jgi:hypothetical protein
MKLLKIFTAVLLFSLLGSMENQVLAQVQEGSWTSTFSVGDSLVNGDFKAKIIEDERSVKLDVTKNNSFFCSYFIYDYSFAGRSHKFKSLSFKKDFRGDLGFSRDFMPVKESIYSILLKDRKTMNEKQSVGYIRNTTVEATDSAFLNLEDDGTLAIYSGTGGMQIIHLDCKR